MYDVRDGNRHLKFEGVKLAASSSQSRGRTRWVEFELYRTAGSQYVLARIGISLYYHTSKCAVVSRNRIVGIPALELPAHLVPCETCAPMTRQEEVLFPETDRPWAQVSDTAEAVINSLYKYDDAGARYLTNVARNLLATAADLDDNISEAFYTEFVQ